MEDIVVICVFVVNLQLCMKREALEVIVREREIYVNSAKGCECRESGKVDLQLGVWGGIVESFTSLDIIRKSNSCVCSYQEGSEPR